MDVNELLMRQISRGSQAKQMSPDAEEDKKGMDVKSRCPRKTAIRSQQVMLADGFGRSWVEG
jgi:hypothetical protein